VSVRDDLVHRANRGARHAGGGEARLDVGEIVPQDPGPDELVGRGAVLQARGMVANRGSRGASGTSIASQSRANG